MGGIPYASEKSLWIVCGTPIYAHHRIAISSPVLHEPNLTECICPVPWWVFYGSESENSELTGA